MDFKSLATKVLMDKIGSANNSGTAESALDALVGGSKGFDLSSVVGQLGMAYSLDHGIPGYIVFQVAPGGGLFFVVLVGILFFKERVSGYGAAGIILGMTALAVLTFG